MSLFRRDYRKEYGRETNGSGSWSYAFTFRKIRCREAGFNTKREAQLAEEMARKKVILEGRVLRPFEVRRFDELGEEVLAHRLTKCSPSTVKFERPKLKALSECFGSKPVHRINSGDVEAFIARRTKTGLSNRTINMHLNLLRAIFKHALKKNYVTHNPMDDVENLKEFMVDRDILSKEDFVRLLAEAAKLNSAQQDAEQLVVWLMVRGYTGVRPSEAAFLQWRDIKWDKEQIMVRPKVGPKFVEENRLKTGEFRMIPISPELMPALLGWKKKWDGAMAQIGRPHDWIFYHPQQPHLRALGFRRSFEAACKNAGLPGMRSYDLRHFFISEAIMAGCELMVVTKWAGHGSVRMIEKVYGHLRPEYHAKQIAKLSFAPAPAVPEDKPTLKEANELRQASAVATPSSPATEKSVA